eukprot:6161830-Pleurochrysis_carterae.AAC.1
MATVNVFGARVVLRVVREVDSRRVVHVQSGGLLRWHVKLVEERPEVDGLFGRLRGGHDLCFAGGE